MSKLPNKKITRIKSHWVHIHVYTRITGYNLNFNLISMTVLKVTQWLKNDVWHFNYKKETKKKYKKFHHTEGFAHYTASPFSLKIVKTHLELHI